jgi:ribose/xylose/arabinose/galactoside ABC-type transport system permease subunit
MTVHEFNRTHPGIADTTFRIGLAITFFVVLAATVSGFAESSNYYAMLETSVPIALTALGVGATIIAGELDLSAGAVATVAGIVTVRAIDIGPVTAVVLVVAIGVVYGCLQGFVISTLKVPSIVFTLGTLIAVGGVAYFVSGEEIVSLPVDKLSAANDVRERIWWILSPASLVMATMFLIVGVFLGYTRAGRELYAVGAAREESRAAGVPQRRPVIIAFALSGGLAATAGALASLRSGSAGPRAYDALLFSAVTAVLIGGVSLYGGRGRVVGIFAGVATLQFLLATLALKSAPFWAADLATGVVLLAFLIIELFNEESVARTALRRLRLARGQPATSGLTPTEG